MIGIGCLLLTCFLVQTPTTGKAQGKFPSRTIKILVPSTAGGPTDVVFRKIADVAGKSMGQDVIIDNRPGAGGLVATSFMAKSKPDGYTLAAVMSATFIVSPFYTKMDFDPLADLTPIAQPYAVVSWVYVATDSPLKTFNDFVAEGRKRQVLVGCVGGLIAEVVLQRIAVTAKMDMKLVPFGGGSACVAPLLGGQVDAIVTSGLVEYARSGKMRQIARLTDAPMKQFKEVPHVKQLGYDVNSAGFVGLFGPKGLPKEVDAKLEEEFGKAMVHPSVIETIEMVGETPNFRNSKDLAVFIRDVHEQSGKMIKELGLGLFSKEKK